MSSDNLAVRESPNEASDRIRSVIDVYLAAVRTADAELFHTAFHADSAIVHCSTGDGTLVTNSLESFIKEVAGLVEQFGVVEEIPRNVKIDIADCIASVRLDFELTVGTAAHTGTDFFTLARAGDRWIITHKLYCM